MAEQKELETYLTETLGAQRVPGASYEFQKAIAGGVIGATFDVDGEEGFIILVIPVDSRSSFDLTKEGAPGSFTIETDDAGFAHLALQNPEIREKVQQLFALGISNLSVQNDSCELSLDWDVELSQVDDLSFISKGASALEGLLRALPVTPLPAFKK